MKRLRTLHFVALAGLLSGAVTMGCDGILGIDGFEAGCLEGEKRCSPTYGKWPQTCAADGLWQNEQPCGNGLTCANGTCVPECTPAERGCLDDSTPQFCNASGAWERLLPCDEGDTCVEGKCKCSGQIATKCIGNAPATCSDGEWQTSSACVGQTCVNGACLGECAPGSSRCKGNTPQSCDVMGAWADSTPCEPGQCKAGSCSCILDDLRCFDNTPQICNASSQWGNLAPPCEKSNQTCDPDEAACIGECVKDARRCVGNTSQTCNEKGQWGDPQDCGGFGCINDRCAACTPGEVRCTGNTPQICGVNGQWIDEPECIDQTCINGTCQGQCASGAARCAANYPQVCNASGSWENNGPACSACKECDANTFTCSSVSTPNDTCTQPTTLTAGRFHTCAVFPDQSLKCWGYNAAGQLGLGDKNDRGSNAGQMGANLPKLDLGAGLLVQDIRAGTTHTCARFSNGSIKCWGNNAFGRLGLGDTNNRGDHSNEMGASLLLVDLGKFSAIAMTAGETHTCAISTDGKVKCWGGNFYGQLGLGDTLARGDQPGEMGANLPTVDLGNGATAARISAGDMHTCAQLSPVVVKCWGNNSFGQLGLGDANHRGDENNEMGANLSEVSLDLAPGIIVKDISAGGTHACVLLSDGSVKCWGNNAFGQLGLGDTKTRGDEINEMGTNLVPVKLGLSLGITVIAISAGSAHTCALLSNGSVKCWGKNDFGQLGLGDTNHRGDEMDEMGENLPIVNLGAGVVATEIRAGHSHTCALLSSGRVKCWGRSVYGQLGQSDTVTRGDETSDMGDTLLPVEL